MFIVSFIHNNEDIFLCYLLKNLLSWLSYLGLNPPGTDFYVEHEVGIHLIVHIGISLSLWTSLGSQMVKNPPAVPETWV